MLSGNSNACSVYILSTTGRVRSFRNSLIESFSGPSGQDAPVVSIIRRDCEKARQLEDSSIIRNWKVDQVSRVPVINIKANLAL